MKVIIAGGRNFEDYVGLCLACDKALLHSKVSEVVSGAAHGADKLGEKYAAENGYFIRQFPANWSKHGRGAGPVRNAQMAGYADMLIAFWDGVSSGTKNMIDTAKRAGLEVIVYHY
ncbi:MAG: DUF2493 domain-containing protein [Cryomorphaceae bacterium]|nr:MAG: DUF2493 domain-containing protein [Cryomorphaceae bacterium]